jgi:hypothetical protein
MGSGANTAVVPVIVTMDTAAADLAVYTPAATTFAAIVGMVGGDSAAFNLTIKGASTALTVIKYAASLPPLVWGLGAGVLVCGGRGEILNFNISAGTPNWIVYVLELEQFYLKA